MSDLESKFMIDGNVVEHETNIGTMSVYSTNSEDASVIKFYFVGKDDNVICSLQVDADCGQNQGYICSHDWEKGNE